MSILLDALKKAALEKQGEKIGTPNKSVSDATIKIAANEASHTLPKSGINVDEASALDLVENESPEEFSNSELELTLDIDIEGDLDGELYETSDTDKLEKDFDEKELNKKQLNENDETNKKNAVVDDSPGLDDDVLDTVSPTDEKNNVYHEQKKIDSDGVSGKDVSEGIEIPLDKKIEDVSSSCEENDTPDDLPSEPIIVNNAIANGLNPITSSNEEQKEAFELLLEKNRRLHRQRKRKFFAWYVALFTIAVFSVIAYFLSVHFSSGKSPMIMSDNNVANYEPLNLVSSKDSSKDFEENRVSTEIFSESEDISSVDTPDQVLDVSQKPKSLESLASKSAAISANSSISTFNKNVEKNNKPKSVSRESDQPVKIRKDIRSKQSDIVTLGDSRINDFDQTIQSAFSAYSAGDYTKAKDLYQQALNVDQNNRDALLGSAAVAVAQNRYPEALYFYQSRLNRAPKDRYAQAGVLAIASTERASSEIYSSVNTLLKEYPDAAHLHFLKGVVLSRESRWSVAQESFFNAWSKEPERRDYAHNLAVALDHLGQHDEALRFYKLAIQSGGVLPVQLNHSAINQRISELEAGR